MRKTLTGIFCIFLVSILTLVPVYAVEEGVSYGDVAKTPFEIKVDGEKDAAYDYALKIHQNRKHYENEPDTATNGDTYILWDDGFIYVFAEITDSTIIPTTEDIQSNTPWMADSMEVFLDVGNDGVDPMQYRIDYTSRPSFQFPDSNSYGLDASAADGIFEYAAKITSTGYAAEFKIPHASAKVGEKIGLQLQINDMADETARTCVFPPNSLGGGSWDVTMYDYIVLADAPEIPETEAETAPVTEGTEPAAQTGDMLPALAVLAAASAAVLFVKKRAK
jgi:hypothetical protein